jgi:ERF superfamily
VSEALVKALGELSEVHKSGRVNAGQRKYTYLTLPDLLGEVRSVLAKHGLAVTQMLSTADTGHMSIRTLILDGSGPVLDSGAVLFDPNPNPQVVGSAVTYMKRYQLAALVGLAGDEDDDGQRAAAPAKAREEYGQTRPVTRHKASPDDPANVPYQTPPPAAQEPAQERLPHTFHPFDPERPASRASVAKMFATLARAGIERDDQRAAIARVFGVDPNLVHTDQMTQRAVSAVIAWYTEEPLT